jgi:hypothetical protein
MRLVPFELSRPKISFLRSCLVFALGFLLLAPLTEPAGAQSAPADDVGVAETENQRFDPPSAIPADRQSPAHSEAGGEETGKESRPPFTVESQFTDGSDSLLAHAAVRLPLTNTALAHTPPEPFREAPQSEAPERWHYRFNPHLWVPSMAGDTTVRGVKTDVGMSMSDVLDSTSAFFETFTAKKGRWFVYHYGMYSVMEDDAWALNQKVESTSTTSVIDLALGYNVLEGSVDAEKEQDITLAFYGGMRYQYMKSEIDVKGPVLFVNVDESHDWLEPLVGAYLSLDIADNFVWDAVLLDLSGFGIGSASDLTVSFYSGIKYQLGETCDLVAGYKIMDIDYDRGSGNARFAQNLSMNGPVLGLSFAF